MNELAALRDDAERATGRAGRLAFVASALLHPHRAAVVDYRCGRMLRGSLVGRAVAAILHAAARAWSSTDIHPEAEIGPGLLVHHGVGVVIGPGTRIGRDCTIYQGVTIGQHHSEEPTIGDRVVLHPGCCVMGGIDVGDDVHVGANAVLLIDVPSGHQAVGVPVTHEGLRPVRWQAGRGTARV